MVCLQVKLCDPHLSTLEVTFSEHDEVLYKSTFTFTITEPMTWKLLKSGRAKLFSSFLPSLPYTFLLNPSNPIQSPPLFHSRPSQCPPPLNLDQGFSRVPGRAPATNAFWHIFRSSHASDDSRFSSLLCNANYKAEANLVAKTLAVDFFLFPSSKSGRASNMACPLGSKMGG